MEASRSMEGMMTLGGLYPSDMNSRAGITAAGALGEESLGAFQHPSNPYHLTPNLAPLPSMPPLPLEPTRSLSPSATSNLGRPPTSAEIDAVIAAAIANAPPVPVQPDYASDISRSKTPLMTNLLPAAVGADGRVNLFVGNLPYRVRWQDLKDLFRKAGTVLRADVSLGQDNRSRGYGTVLMGSREDAARAIDRYNGFTWQTRTLEVRPDRLPPEYEAQQQFPHHVNPHPPAHPSMPSNYGGPGGSLPSFIAGSQTHPYPHPHTGPGAWQGPSGPGANGPGASGNAGPNRRQMEQGHLHHPFPQPAVGLGQGQGGLLLPNGGTGGAAVNGAGQGQSQQGFGSFNALAASQSGVPGAGATAGLTPPSTGASQAGTAGERDRDSDSPFPVAASPLAGALTGAGASAGGIPNALPVPAQAPGFGLDGRRDSTTSKSSPFMRYATPGDGYAAHRHEAHSKSFSTSSTSHHPLYPTQSRGAEGGTGALASPPFGSAGANGTATGQSSSHAHTSSMSASTSNRAAPPGSLGPLPPNYFAALAGSGSSSSGPSGNKVAAAAPHFPVQIEGMAHQGVGLGPPQNLHDRVIFVSNLPLDMQWQDLKDMLRPAGLVMRVDVAQDDDRRPRGYGTALFATEGDATRAVQMFNGCEIGGNRIRVYLERDNQVAGASQATSTASSNGGDDSTDSSSKRTTLSAGGAKGKAPGGASPARTKVPWGINTTLAQTPIRNARVGSSPNGTPYAQLPHSPGSFPGGPTPGPSFRTQAHPGPITMPPFAPLDPNTPAHTNHLNPLSPQMRGLPPMTPSMPGFVFNGYPDTPGPHFFSQQQGFGGFGMHMGMSMMPMGMMTPGPVIAPAPFSPGLPMSPMHPQTPNPFLNTAPGAPIDRILAQAQAQGQSNGAARSVSWGSAINGIATPARPGEGLRGSAALGTPTTTVSAGRGAERGGDVSAETPGPIRGKVAQGNGGAGYFPYVPEEDVEEATTPSRARKGGRQTSYGVAGDAKEGEMGLESLMEKVQLRDIEAPLDDEEAGHGQQGTEGEDEVKGRQSLDDARPRAVSIGSRRASFGDRR